MRKIFLLFLTTLFFGCYTIVFAANYGIGSYNEGLYSATNDTISLPSNGSIVLPFIPKDNSVKKDLILEKPKEFFSFSKNLFLKDRGDDVIMLQKYLNSEGFYVAKTGIASLGQETDYFGIATKNALKNFQKSKGITPTGNLGPKTRAFINSSIDEQLYKLKVTTLELNVRSLASTKGSILGTVYKGDTGVLLLVSGNWFKIRFDKGVEGFVYKKFVTFLK